MTKIDFRKQHRDLYQPPAKKFTVVDVPPMQFLMVDGHGDPNTAAEYQDAIESLTHISTNYFSVSPAIKELHKTGIKIKRNAFERRLDRGRIPHVKIGGRRFIHEDVMRELPEKESALRK